MILASANDYDPVAMLWEYLNRFAWYHVIADHWLFLCAFGSFVIGWAFGKFFVDLLGKLRERVTGAHAK
jgi:hypothetical protein